MEDKRARFKSIWNGIATIIFFAGIFLNSTLFSYSAVMLGIFMWVISGVLTDMIFGPKNTESPKTIMKDSNVSVAGNCTACGGNINSNDEFCLQCGTKLEFPAK